MKPPPINNQNSGIFQSHIYPGSIIPKPKTILAKPPSHIDQVEGTPIYTTNPPQLAAKNTAEQNCRSHNRIPKSSWRPAILSTYKKGCVDNGWCSFYINTQVHCDFLLTKKANFQPHIFKSNFSYAKVRGWGLSKSLAGKTRGFKFYLFFCLWN